MCRLFGFRSVIHSQVHSSLTSADNALALQSNQHPDGWGVSYFVSGAPHIIKSEMQAIQDSLFQKVSGVVSSQTVLAHIRKATLGGNSILNTHPFQYGCWVFAHNGNIKNFQNIRQQLAHMIDPELRRFILGDTDSEMIFYLVLTHLQKKHSLEDRDCPIQLLAEATKEAMAELVALVGAYSHIDDAGDKENYFTFIMTNGSTMLAHQGGKILYYSTYKSSCGDRDTCPSFSPECEAPTKDGRVNHLIFSSEPLSGENIWIPLKPGQILGVDASMTLEEH